VARTSPGAGLILALVRRQWKGVAAGVVVGLAWTLAKVSVPLVVAQAIDEGIDPYDQSALVFWTCVILGLGVIAAAFTGMRRYLAFRESRWAETDLRDRLFAHLQRLHFSFHDESQTGELMSRANTDLQQIQQLVVLIPLTMSNLLTVVAVTLILVSINPVLAVLALAGLPFVNVLAKRFSTRLQGPVMGIQRESAQLASVVEETVSGVRVVKGFGAEPVQAARLRVEADDVFDESMAAARIRATYLPALDLLPNIGLIAVLGYGGHLVLTDQLSLGDLVAFNVYVVLLIWPLRMLGMIVAQWQRSVASAERVHEILDTTPVIVDHASGAGLPPRVEGEPVGEVRFEGVRFAYAPGAAPILDGLDLVVPAGESVAVVGATGSGKTTIARLLPRFYDVDEGRILIDGVEVTTLALRSLRRSVGIVFEDTFLFSDSVAGNIAFADPEASVDAIERAARLAGAHEFIERLPAGYATEIGERGFSLSGGQRQRIAIARAILADPRVLILDDATSSVDPTKEHEIRDAMRVVMEGRTTVVIAHRPATIALADRVVVLADGRVVAAGTHEQLLAESDRYREILAAGERDESDELDAEVGSGTGPEPATSGADGP
jgi:ATP-binding cassette subfamily B protein